MFLSEKSDVFYEFSRPKFLDSLDLGTIDRGMDICVLGRILMNTFD